MAAYAILEQVDPGRLNGPRILVVILAISAFVLAAR
jgi:hypothetical protein